MLQFGRTTDYAILALAHLVEHDGEFASARQIAQSVQVPLPLLSRILKCLHHNGLLESTRGSRGGYRIAVDLRDVSIDGLVRMLRRRRIEDEMPIEPPLRALYSKFMRALSDVKLSDLVIPGRRIDVPIESLRFRRSATVTLQQVCA